MKWILRTVDETVNLGIEIGKLLSRGMFIALHGDLASGKTTFTKGIARGLGIDAIISSPTFTIMKVYSTGRLPLFHVDAYRLAGNDYDLGIDEYRDDGVMVMEWPEFYEDVPDEYLEMKFLYVDDDTREVSLIPHGACYEQIVKELGKC